LVKQIIYGIIFNNNKQCKSNLCICIEHESMSSWQCSNMNDENYLFESFIHECLIWCSTTSSNMGILSKRQLTAMSNVKYMQIFYLQNCLWFVGIKSVLFIIHSWLVFIDWEYISFVKNLICILLEVDRKESNKISAI
jgi:hypothetical protein